MKIRIDNIDKSGDIGLQLKNNYNLEVANMIRLNRRDSDNFSKITLFHGTTLRNLNNILINGLLPRKITNNEGNFTGHLKSNPELVYLTNKWHYKYAMMGMDAYKTDTYQKEGFDVGDIPCYVEVEVRICDLLPDEDFINYPYVINKVSKSFLRKDDSVKVVYDECLKNFGTVAHIGRILPSSITSFTILGNLLNFIEVIMANDGQYNKDILNHVAGKGVGKLNLSDLFKLETVNDNYKSNTTYWQKDIIKLPEEFNYNDRYFIRSIEPTNDLHPLRLEFGFIKNVPSDKIIEVPPFKKLIKE